MSHKRLLQDKTISRLHVERTQNKLDSSGQAGETRGSSSSTMKFSGADRRGTDRVLQRYDCKSWALAWHTDWSKERCSI
jgi:hypothetical protein